MRKKNQLRKTIEVLDLDEDSASLSPRACEKIKTKDSQDAEEEVPHSKEKQEGVDYFSFENEYKRVTSAKDAFLPSSSPIKNELELQKRRLKDELSRLKQIEEQEQIQAKNRKMDEISKSNRTKYLDREIASVKIQALFRGQRDRKRVEIIKKNRAKKIQQVAEWKQVHSEETGEVWYYNEVTKQSQWEPPLVMRQDTAISTYDRLSTPMTPLNAPQSPLSLAIESDAIKSEFGSFTHPLTASSEISDYSSLPPLTPSIPSTPATAASTLPSRGYIPTPSRESTASSGYSLPDLHGNNSHTPRSFISNGDSESILSTNDAEIDEMNQVDLDNLFLADGRRNAGLRSTIQKALKRSRFDSVSTLLSTGLMSKKENLNSPKKNPTASREIVFGKTKAKHISAVLMHGEKGRSKSAKKYRDQSSLPPEIKNVAFPGFENSTLISTPEKLKLRSKDVCLPCWTSGKGACEAHRDKHGSFNKNYGSSLMCSNWSLDELRKKFRAEELQEVFGQRDESLRYDSKRKQFVTVVEDRHPMYKVLAQFIGKLNNTARRRIHAKAWFRSYLDTLRSGQVAKASSSVSKLMRLRKTLRHMKWIRGYADATREFLPVPGYTKTCYDEFKIDCIYVNSKQPYMKHWLIPTCIPKPIDLYKPRQYLRNPIQCVPMPQPTFIMEMPLPVPNRLIESYEKHSWFERLAGRIAVSGISKAQVQLMACAPPKDSDQIRRTKYPPPLTVTFASFGRKATSENMAVGGLCAELIIHMLVTTYVPPQFGNFIVMDSKSISPNITQDFYAQYACLIIPQQIPTYVSRQLQHPLNARKSPTITISTRPEAKDLHYHGTNRPEQTGEEGNYGFRTSEYFAGIKRYDETRATSFVPSTGILSPNLPKVNQSITTHVDRHYPFCEPTTTSNTVYEFANILWNAKSTRNQTQCFTSLGNQESGSFMRGGDQSGELGSCIDVVYRSWAYMQSSPYEEFVADNGLAYWYNRRTGETFWERPALDSEVSRGGDGGVDGTITDGKGELATLGVGLKQSKYPPSDIRKYINRSMETPNQKIEREDQMKKSALKHNIRQPEKTNINMNAVAAAKSSKKEVPKLNFNKSKSKSVEKSSEFNMKPQNVNKPLLANKSNTNGKKEIKQNNILGIDTQNLIETITKALGSSLPTLTENSTSVNMLQLGLGLGMGLSLGHQQSVGANDEDNNVPKDDKETIDEDEARSSLSTERSFETTRTMSTFRSEKSNNEIGIEATATPDEKLEEMHQQGKDFISHQPAGLGVSWVHPSPDGSTLEQTEVDGTDGLLHKSVAVLPQGFVDSIRSTKSVAMEADYLPVVLNMNEAKNVGVVKPRKAAEDWFAMEYDPWSAGKERFATQFIKKIISEEIEEIPQVAVAVGSKAPLTQTQTGITVSQFLTGAAKKAHDLDSLISMCRHGKMEDIEVLLDRDDCDVKINDKDGTGNTMLSVACQNNNKKLAKFCLRKGGEINTQNINGQTPLHYCFAYGFHDLAEYLISKGADPTIVNADGLTCYEGLSKEQVDAI